VSQQLNDEGQLRGMRRSEFLRGVTTIGIAAGLSGVVSPASAQDVPPVSNGAASPKPATRATKDVNALYRRGLPFNDTRDFSDARRGLLASLPGMTPREIGERIRLPPTLAVQWPCRSYYGSVYHDAVAQYNLRLGFFDGVPANLHQHTPIDSGRRYVAFMGGADNVLRQARQSYEEGDYRWIAEVVNHVVFANPDNAAAKNLLADAYEQLGYQAESGPWRNFYLTGALELRRGVTKLPVPNTASPDTIRAMPIEMFFDFLGVRLNGDRAADLTVAFNLELTDTKEKYVLGVENAAIHYSGGRTVPNADASIVMTRDALNDVMLGTATMEKQIVTGKAKLTGDPKKLASFVSCLDTFDFWFNIVTA
jgi:alkyl sulfatase BDS1-like metallo-beta-lactamase superfamily hydrolase